MRKNYVFMAIVVAVLFGFASLAMAVLGMPKDEIVNKAKKAITDKGIAVVDCNIVYDEENKRWEEWGVYVAKNPKDKNYGKLPHGVLKKRKYQAVYFDFVDDAKKDIWAFVDLDTGEVLAIYAKK
jgi:hypothetical protein